MPTLPPKVPKPLAMPWLQKTWWSATLEDKERSTESIAIHDAPPNSPNVPSTLHPSTRRREFGTGHQSPSSPYLCLRLLLAIQGNTGINLTAQSHDAKTAVCSGIPVYEMVVDNVAIWKRPPNSPYIGQHCTRPSTNLWFPFFVDVLKIHFPRESFTEQRQAPCES